MLFSSHAECMFGPSAPVVLNSMTWRCACVRSRWFPAFFAKAGINLSTRLHLDEVKTRHPFRGRFATAASAVEDDVRFAL